MDTIPTPQPHPNDGSQTLDADKFDLGPDLELEADRYEERQTSIAIELFKAAVTREVEKYVEEVLEYGPSWYFTGEVSELITDFGMALTHDTVIALGRRTH